MASDGAFGDGAFGAAARSWVAHLEAGGTTSWADWVDQVGTAPAAATTPEVPPATASGDRAGLELPGAAQLELLRRLNQEGPLPPLGDHVLTRPGPGRGGVHLPLSWPPVRPTAPAAEVRRVAVGVLADLTATLEEPPRRKRRTRTPRRRHGPTFVLEGLPLTVAALREELATAGLVEHRPRPPWFTFRRRSGDLPDLVLVVAGPVDEALHEVWTRRVLDGAHRSWRGFLSTWAARDALPPSADLGRALEHWVSRVGPGRVHLLVVPRGDEDDLAGWVEDLLGHRSDGVPLGGDAPWPAYVDLLRRVNDVLPFLLPEEGQERARRALVSLLREEGHGPRRVGLPRGRRQWAARSAERLIDAVRASGVTVHGDLHALASHAPSARGVRAVDTLAAAVRMIQRIEQTGPRTGSAGEGTGR